MKSEIHPQELTQVPFQQNRMWCRLQHQYRYTRAFAGRIDGVSVFQNQLLRLFSSGKASEMGALWLSTYIALKDNTVLILSPHIHQEWPY